MLKWPTPQGDQDYPDPGPDEWKDDSSVYCVGRPKGDHHNQLSAKAQKLEDFLKKSIPKIPDGYQVKKLYSYLPGCLYVARQYNPAKIPLALIKHLQRKIREKVSFNMYT